MEITQTQIIDKGVEMEDYTYEEYNRAYVELLEILKHIPVKDLKKVPRDILQYYLDNRDLNYTFKYNKNIEFEEQNVMELTQILFANLYIDYWATPERKTEIVEQDKEEMYKLEIEKREEYKVDDLFKKRQKIENKVDETTDLAVIKKKNFIEKIIDRIKKILKLT